MAGFQLSINGRFWVSTEDGESLKNPQVQSVVGWAREQTDAINTRVEKLLSDSAAARAMAATHESKHFPNE